MGSGARGFLLPLTSAALAVLVIGLAAPRVAAYGLIAPWAETVPPALAAGQTIAGDPLEAAAADYARAAALFPSDHNLARDAARLSMRLGREDDAEALLRRSLIAAPNRTFAWALLARIEAGKPSSDAFIPMLRLSYTTGPREASSLLVRASVSLPRWADLPDDIKAAIRADIRHIHEAPFLRKDLVRLYILQDIPGRIVIREAALLTPQEARIFDRAVLRASGRT